MTPRRRVLFGAQAFETAQLNAFKTRVQGDAGAIEAEECLRAQIKRLQELGLYEKASLIVTPNAYKASKIYSLKPTSGAGDLTFTRAGVKRVRNAAGNWVEIGANVPPLHYPVGGGCPAWLIEPQATNYVTENNALMTQWTIGTNLSRASSTMVGFNSVILSALANSAINSGFAHVLRRTSAIPVQVGVNCFSFIARKTASHNSVGVIWSGTQAQALTWNLDTLAYNVTLSNANFTSQAGGVIPFGDNSFFCWTSFTSSVSATMNCDFAPCNSNSLNYVTGNEIEIAQPKFEYTAFPTSPIVTGSGTVTRIADASITSLAASGVLPNTDGCLFVEYNPLGFGRESSRIITLTTFDLNNRIFLSYGIDNRITVFVRNTSGGIWSATAVATQINGWNKLAINFISGSMQIWLNGAEISTTAAVLSFASQPNFFYYGTVETAGVALASLMLRPALVFQSKLSTAEVQALTTL